MGKGKQHMIKLYEVIIDLCLSQGKTLTEDVESTGKPNVVHISDLKYNRPHQTFFTLTVGMHWLYPFHLAVVFLLVQTPAF